MTLRQELEREYIDFAKKSGYVPNFKTSVEEILDFPSSTDDSLQEFDAVDEADLTPLARDMKRALSQATTAEREFADAQMDPTGYSAHFEEVRASNYISDSTLERIYCAEFPTGDFNACARRARHGYLCLINQGLRFLLYKLSVAASSRLGGEGSPDFEHTIYYVAELCQKYLTGHTGGETSRNIQHDLQAFKTGGALSGAMRTFVVAHEVAHVELGHLDSGELKAWPTPVGKVEFIQKSLHQEFEADALAQEILIAAAPKVAARADGQGSMMFVCGGVCFLTVEMIVSQCKRIFLRQGTPAVNTTHPPSKDRIAALHEIIQQTTSPTDYQDLKIIEGIFRDIYDVLARA